MRQRSRNVLTKGLNADADPRFVGEGEWVKSFDVVNYGRGRDGSVKAMWGNAEIDLTPVALPAGTNTCIGSREDEHSKSVVWMNHNSNNRHGIYRYWYETGRVDEVMVYPGFEFELHRKIHDIVIVDGRYLIWTDVLAVPYELGGNPLPTSEGKQPRCVDMERATLLGGTIEANTGNIYKSLQYDLCLHFIALSIEALAFPILIQIKATNIDATADKLPWTTIATITAQPDDDYETTKANIYNEMALALSALGYPASDERNFARVTAPPGVGGTRLQFQVLENGSASTKVRGYIMPVNHYRFPLVDEQFDMARPMPLDVIDASYVRDFKETTGGGDPIYESNNQSFGTNHQFVYRYVFYDGGRSAWSPYSIVPTNMQSEFGTNLPFRILADPLYNKVLLRLIDEKLTNEWLGFITKIEIGFRVAMIKPFVTIGAFYPWQLNELVRYGDVDEYDNTGWQKVFTGNINEGAIGSDEDGGDGQSQVLKNHDWVPHRVNGLGVVTDENGASRVVVGGEVLGYQNPKVKARLELINAWIPTTFDNANQQRSRKFLKKGGRYNVCVFYYDKKGYTPGAVKLGEINVPFNLQAQNVPYLRVNFDSSPPEWAVRWRIGITKNLKQGKYLQLAATPHPVIRVIEKNQWEYSTWEDATHIPINIGLGIDPPSEDDLEIKTADLFEWGQGRVNEIMWIPEPKDKIRGVYQMRPKVGNPSVLTVSDINTTLNIDTAHYDAFIVGTLFRRINALKQNQYHVVVEKSEVLRDWYDTAIMENLGQIGEIYKHSTSQDTLYYELPVGGVVHNVGLQYTHLPQGDPQRIDVRCGDTYYQNTSFAGQGFFSGIRDIYLEATTQYNIFIDGDVVNDWGRPFTEFDGESEYNYQRIRISDQYTPATKINGLFSFRGLAYIDINVDYGPVMSIKSTRDDIAVVCWNKIQPIYVGKGRVLQLDGGEQVGRSTSLLTLARPLIEDIGTQHPESLACDGRRIWGVDKRVGAVWRYSNDGITVLTDKKNRKYFHDIFLATESSYTTHLYILGGWNPRMNMYMFTITAHVLKADKRDSVQVPARTFGFCEADNEWKDEFRLIPEMWGVGGIHMLSWKAGKPWLSDQVETNFPAPAVVPPANYFGVQYYPSVTIVVNQDPMSTKVWQNIRMQSDFMWWVPEIRTDINEPYGSGMRSRLKPGNIRNEEGMFIADVLRDMNDPDFSDIVDPTQREVTALLRGRPLRSEVLFVTLEATTPDADLMSVDTEWFKSEKT